jgi:hypothetical protein
MSHQMVVRDGPMLRQDRVEGYCLDSTNAGYWTDLNMIISNIRSAFLGSLGSLTVPDARIYGLLTIHPFSFLEVLDCELTDVSFICIYVSAVGTS